MGEQGRLPLRLFLHYYVNRALRHFIGYLYGVYRLPSPSLPAHSRINSLMPSRSGLLIAILNSTSLQPSDLVAVFRLHIARDFAQLVLVGGMDNVHVTWENTKSHARIAARRS